MSEMTHNFSEAFVHLMNTGFIHSLSAQLLSISDRRTTSANFSLAQLEIAEKTASLLPILLHLFFSIVPKGAIRVGCPS